MKLATLCYIKDNGKTLMLFRNKKENDYHEGKWNGIGGKFEPSETPEECAIREIKEETGLIAEALTLKGLITFPLFDGVDDWYVFLFVITKFSGELIDSPEGELSWIDDDKLLELNLWDGDRIFIPWLKEDKFFSAKFNYKGKRFKDFDVSFY
jgi:8-oxo-dGTP diphosphatase